MEKQKKTKDMVKWTTVGELDRVGLAVTWRYKDMGDLKMIWMV